MPRTIRYLPVALGAVLVAAVARPLPAQLQGPPPPQLEGVDIVEHPNALLPMDAVLRDEQDREVTLGEFFTTGKPVLLTLNYADCPMLCQLQLHGLVNTLRNMEWEPGQQFSIVTISIDPLETRQRAALAKQKHLQAYGRPGTAAGWHFLRGDVENIRRVADTVGFGYRYVPERNEYAHAAVMMVCTPTGNVSRYLYGVEFAEGTLRLSLVEAGEGKIGSALDRVLLFCFHYDATAGRYGPAARRLMQLAAGVTVAIIFGGLAPFWLRRRRLEQPTVAAPTTEGPSTDGKTRNQPAAS